MNKKDNDALIVYAVIVGVLVALVTIKALLNPVIVSGDSMYPTYHDGETVRLKATENINYNDVVVFDLNDNKCLIKRVVALAGDTVQIIGGKLYVNGEEQETEFDLMENSGIAKGKIKISDDCVFVLGDNRNNSQDSRYFGEVSVDTIRGVVTGRLWG